MGAFGLKSIDQTLQLTHLWLNELLERTGWSDKQRAYRLLRVTLQATRDHLPVNEAVDLGAQLPQLIRGVYYEGWHPAGTPVKMRSRDEFLGHIQEAFKTDPMDDAEEAVGAVFALLSDRIAEGEMADVRHALPKQIRGCCQTNANQPQFALMRRVSGCAELTPLGESDGAVELKI